MVWVDWSGDDLSLDTVRRLAERALAGMGLRIAQHGRCVLLKGVPIDCDLMEESPLQALVQLRFRQLGGEILDKLEHSIPILFLASQTQVFLSAANLQQQKVQPVDLELASHGLELVDAAETLSVLELCINLLFELWVIDFGRPSSG